MIITAGTQHPDRPPASLRFMGLNKITKQHHMIITAGTQHPDRLPASLRLTGLNKITTAEMRLADRTHASPRLMGDHRLPAETEFEGP